MPETVKYMARLAENEQDIQAVQKLRGYLFGTFKNKNTLDIDPHDVKCRHVLIESVQTGALCACFRFMYFQTGAELDQSYSAQFYDLKRLKVFRKPIIEIGRFCMRSDIQDFEPLRVAWAFLTQYVDQNKIALMLGCSSFKGTDEGQYTDAFALLKERHLAPDIWKPKPKAKEIFRFADRLKSHKPILKQANKSMPPLLRSYLGMGGWVSDHAVVDRNLNTLHVFTGVEVRLIPRIRARLLRAQAAALGA